MNKHSATSPVNRNTAKHEHSHEEKQWADYYQHGQDHDRIQDNWSMPNPNNIEHWTNSQAMESESQSSQSLDADSLSSQT